MEHPLRAYRKANKITLEALSESAGITAASLSRIERALLTPSFKLMRRVREITGGAVTPNDFVDAEQFINEQHERAMKAPIK